jgi:hypothetical protein
MNETRFERRDVARRRVPFVSSTAIVSQRDAHEVLKNQEIGMTTRVEAPVATLDDARREFCQRFATAIREGGSGIQVRFLKVNQEITEAWIYVYHEHEWRKRNDLAISAHLVGVLWELLESLSTREFADAWTCRRAEHSDRTDFELKFHREALEQHLEGDLESYLNGCLFHGHHDSGKDERRRIRFQGR